MDSDSIDPGSNPGGTCAVRDSIVASIPACHAGDRGSIPRRGEFFIDTSERLRMQYYTVPLSILFDCTFKKKC